MTCTTHHYACECREAEHAKEIADRDGTIAELRSRLSATVLWLEANQPDVFRRGLWDAINAAAIVAAKKAK